MNDLTFERIHESVAEAFPALARPLTLLTEDDVFSTNGIPSQYGGTGQLLEVYLAVLLALPSSPLRNGALRRALAFVERMLASNEEDLVGLAEIQLIEGQPTWWFQRALPFAGPLFRRAAGRMGEPGWAEATSPGTPPQPPRLRLHDLYGVRPAVAAMLAPDGVLLADLPDVEPPS